MDFQQVKMGWFNNWFKNRFTRVETRTVALIDDQLANKDSQINLLMKDIQAKSGEISRMKADTPRGPLFLSVTAIMV